MERHPPTDTNVWQPGEQSGRGRAPCAITTTLGITAVVGGLACDGSTGMDDSSSSGKTGKERKTQGFLHEGATWTLVVGSILIESMFQDKKKATKCDNDGAVYFSPGHHSDGDSHALEQAVKSPSLEIFKAWLDKMSWSNLTAYTTKESNWTRFRVLSQPEKYYDSKSKEQNPRQEL